MKKKLWQDLNEQQAEQLSGGLKRLQEEFAAELAILEMSDRQPEAEGKIRGILLFGMA